MVVDMLTSSQEQIPPRVPPMEEDSFCPRRRSDRHPQDVSHAPVFHRSKHPGGSSVSRSPKTFRTNRSDSVDSGEHRVNSSDKLNKESHEDREESEGRQTEDKPIRSCKRKLELMSLSSGSTDVTKAQYSEKKDQESPPPAKRWVIGPLFQTFKSKMASFTEIVMSPVRLFKPNEIPDGSSDDCPSVTCENKEDVRNEGKEYAFPKKGKTNLSVVQMLNFDSDPSNLSDSEQNKGTISQSGSEHKRDSISEDDGSYGSLNPTSTRSTSPVTEAVTASDVQQCGSEEHQNCKSVDPHPLSHTGTHSLRVSLRKGSAKAEQGSAVLCERQPSDDLIKGRDQDQPLPKKSRLPTPAVGKRKKGSRLERDEREEVVKSMEKKETDGTLEQEEGSPEVMQIKSLENPTLIQTLKRRKARVSVERLSMCRSGVVYISGSCNSSTGERMALTRASRSKSKRENNSTCMSVVLDTNSVSSSCILPDVLSTNVTHDSTPAGGPPSTGSVTCASSHTTRRRKHNKPSGERNSDSAESGCRDPADRLTSSTGASEHLKPERKNNIHRAKHDSETAKKTNVSKRRRVQRDVEAFKDQGMSMSLTLKVGSGLDGEEDASSIITCGIMTKGMKTGEDVILAGASCPSGTTPEERFCVKDGDDEVEQENDPKAGPTSSGWNRLQRSFSCPDITSLQHGNDSPSAPVHDKTSCLPAPLKKGDHVNVNAPSPVKRTRRHTVCSVEIEREIAPLCLRKEVYPKWGGTSDHSYLHSPSKSLAALVSCFLSSPLAFLSKKSSRGHGDDSGYGASSSDLAAASSSPSPPSLSSPATSRAPDGSAFYADTTHALEQSSLSSGGSMFAGSMETDEGVVHQESEEIQRSLAAFEEKALSDSEIKTDNKQVERRKVSSIRIRKTLPKPQYNLTPMGLPKAVRIKKKVFSVEEIYTNKNFSKPPEGRLETIFEVPLSRRDGSQSLIGPKRVKRFVEFQEVGVARKPRRPPVGGGGGGLGGGAQRKTTGNPGAGRTRRGREGEVLHLQDFDSLLCSKLNELDVWMAREQMVY